MKPRFVVRWKPWLWILLAAGMGAAVIDAWLAPQNVASWLLLSAFCS